MSHGLAEQKRHCWECRRRCLVCDSAQPGCKRCAASNFDCPGYGDVKPVKWKWLEPGRVKSRRKRPEKGDSSKDQKVPQDVGDFATDMFGDEGVSISRIELTTELCALSQAVGYYNTCIYHELLPMEQLGSSPFIYPILAKHVQHSTKFPDYLRFHLVCTTLSHRMNRIRHHDPNHRALAEAFYRYRGVVIQSLQQDKSLEGKQISDVFIAGIISLLLIDIQHGASPNWRWHLEAIQRLITLRGGIKKLANTKKVDSLLLCFIGVSVLGNTTCPASDIAMTDSHTKELEYMIQYYDHATFGFLMCPPALFAEIIRINALRMRAAKLEDTEKLSVQAQETLERIEAYSPTQWAGSKPAGRNNWLALGAIYKSAMAIYCISSLQSSCLLPSDVLLSSRCATHAQQLKPLLECSMANPSVERFLLWPLTVLGVQAAHGDLTLRQFIRKSLEELSCYLGSHVPLEAKNVLERFWESGRTDWDICFDRPYAFATQIAVDVSQISPSG